MAFLKGIKKGLRAEGVYLDAKQARTLLRLIERGFSAGLVMYSTEEIAVFNLFAKRCEELKA